MSANVNTLGSAKKIALIAANPGISKQTGWPIGFWWSELTHPYWEFTEKGYQVDIYSPGGGKLEADSFSDPEDESGYSAHDIISLGFKKSPQLSSLLENTPSIDALDINAYDGIFLTGGQSPMYTFIDNEKLHRLVADFHDAGKVVAVICHATCVLLKVKDKDGKLLVEGKTWTGFADAEEQFADDYAGTTIQPFRIETEARTIPGTNYVNGGLFKPFAVRDGNLITGQQQFSGAQAARMVIEALGA